jgi:hypothetical protein
LTLATVGYLENIFGFPRAASAVRPFLQTWLELMYDLKDSSFLQTNFGHFSKIHTNFKIIVAVATHLPRNFVPREVSWRTFAAF